MELKLLVIWCGTKLKGNTMMGRDDNRNLIKIHSQCCSMTESILVCACLSPSTIVAQPKGAVLCRAVQCAPVLSGMLACLALTPNGATVFCCRKDRRWTRLPHTFTKRFQRLPMTTKTHFSRCFRKRVLQVEIEAQ